MLDRLESKVDRQTGLIIKLINQPTSTGTMILKAPAVKKEVHM
jgi:hypothetical protein